MKHQHRIISFLLVLSLLFSSLVFTASATDIDNEFADGDFVSSSTADYTLLTEQNRDTLNGMLKAPCSQSGSYLSGPEKMYNGTNVDTYMVHATEGANDNSYVMVVPSESAKQNGYTPDNFYFSSNLVFNIKYTDPASDGYTPTYFVFDYDVATESTLFPLQVWINSRYNGPRGGISFDPLTVSECFNITPGVFYHMTLVYDINANMLYVYMNDTLVQTITKGIISDDSLWNNFVNNGYEITIEGIRMELNKEKSQKVAKELGSLEDLSICLDNFSNRKIEGTAAADLAKYAGTGSLAGWGDNVIDQSNVGSANSAYKYLPSLIKVNNTIYNNIAEANKALDTIKAGNKAAFIRSCYSARLTVNSDATISTALSEAEIVAGPDVDLTKINSNTWEATVKTGVFKLSASIIPELENTRNLEKYVNYFANDNIIDTIEQTQAINSRTFSAEQFDTLCSNLLKVAYPTLSDSERAAKRSSFETQLKTLFSYNSGNSTYYISDDTMRSGDQTMVSLLRKASVTGNIMLTNDGNEYLIIEDSSGFANDFPLNIHYQVNATLPYKSDFNTYMLGDHDYIVFEQDIHSESSFINIYSNFNLRSPADKSLSITQVFADGLAVTPEKWYHLTYVGDVSSGDSYLFLDGTCVAKIVGGLYNNHAIVDMAVYHKHHTLAEGESTNDYSLAELAEIVNGLTAEEKQHCIETMVLAGFRTMQVAGENKSGQTLNPGMSAASDNYYLRWIDGESDLADNKKLSTLLAAIDADYNATNESGNPDKTINGVYSIKESWGQNVFNSDYETNVLPKKALIATINGVEYFDTTSINAVLNDTDYSTALKEIILYRDYIGDIIVNCRATVLLNGRQSSIIFNTYNESTNPTGCIVEEVKENGVTVSYNVYKQASDEVTEVPINSTVKTYKEVAATTENILAQWKSNKSGNLYSGHALKTSANTIQTEKFNTSSEQYEYDASFPIYDRGSQTHTLSVGTSIAASITTERDASIQITGTRNYTATITNTVTVTEVQQYLAIEFDILNTGSQNFTITNTIDGNDYPLFDNIGSYLSNGSYSHVTIIGTVNASATGNVGTTISSANSSSVTTSSSSELTVKYSMTYKLFVDNVCKATTSELLGGNSGVSNWNSVKLTNSGNNMTVGNVHISTVSITNQYTNTVTASGSKSTNKNTAATNARSSFNNDKNYTTKAPSTLTNTNDSSVTLANAGSDPAGTTKIDDCFDSISVGDSFKSNLGYGKTDDYVSPTVTAPADTTLDTTYQSGSFEVSDPIAAVDGVLYYENGAVDENGNPRQNTLDVLQATLQNNTVESRDVTFLRVPAESITISCNANVDTNGIDGIASKITYDTTNCVTKTEGDVTVVINTLSNSMLATLNGVDYMNGDEDALQEAIDAAREINLEFYAVPDKALVINNAATVDTNGLVSGEHTIDSFFTTDINNFVVTSSGEIYTVTEFVRSGTVEIRVVVNNGNSTEIIATHKVNAVFGTDIAELLTDKGLMNGVFIVDGKEINITDWETTPSGVIAKEDGSDGSSAYVFVANVDTESSKEITSKYACVKDGVITESNSEADVRKWLNASGEGTIIFNSDILFDNGTNGTISVYGANKNIYLNGNTIAFKSTFVNTNATTGVQSVSGHHGMTLNSNTELNFFGEGTINYNDNWLTQSLFFCGYDFTGKVSLNDIDVNVSSTLAVIRGGNVELIGCNVDAFMTASESVFFLGEQYNNSYSKNPMSLNLHNTEINLRHKSSNNVSVIRNLTVTYTGNPTDGNYAVGEFLGKDVDRTVIVDGCKISSQGAFIKSNEGANWNTMSGLKAYVNDTDISAKSIVYGNAIQSGTLMFYDNVRVSDDNTDGISFATNLVAAKTSDGIYKVLYTSSKYVHIIWSNGDQELWATGSTPTHPECKYDYITVDGLGENQADTSYSATTGYPFNLLTNLTLSDVIGFNIYIPTVLKNGTAVDLNDVKIYMDGKLVNANCFVGTSTVRTSFVHLAKDKGFGDGYCYDYTYSLRPQDAAKTFTLVIVYKNTVMSRTISVGDYIEALANTSLSQKNKELLQVAIAYIEQAANYAGSSVSLDKITKVKDKLGTLTVAPTAPTLPETTHTGVESDLRDYISGVQINVRDNCTFRFNLTDNANAANFKFYVANDKGDGYMEVYGTKIGDGYVEVSFRAYEMARSIKIEYTDGDTAYYKLYSLYEYYTALTTLINNNKVTLNLDGVDTLFVTGAGYELTAAQKLVATLYSYASVCDRHIDRNASEYEPQN